MPRKGKYVPQERFRKLLSPKPILRRFDDTTSQQEIAKTLGVHPTAVSQWQRGGRIHWILADTIAVRLGTHPAELWGDEWSTLHLPDLTNGDSASV